MPIIKSAKKRVKTARKASIRNLKTKRSLRGAVKSYEAALKSGKDVAGAHAAVQSALDKAVKKGLMHKNKVARKKRQLAAAAKKAGKNVAVKAVKKTPPAKKPVKKTAKK